MIVSVILLARLRQRTSAAHRLAEGNSFFQQLADRTLHFSSHANLVRQYLALYGWFEQLLCEHALAPWLAPLLHPDLRRSERLDTDFAALQVPLDELRLDKTLERFIVEAQARVRAEPMRLLSYVYVRYLGDLSGGQMMRAMLSEQFVNQPRAQFSFYDFGTPEEATALKDAMRGVFATLAVNAEEAEAVCAEAEAVFSISRELLQSCANAHA